MSICLIDIKNLNKRFKNLEVIKDLSLKIIKGNIYLLTGENGSGKSTLLKLLVGLYKPTSGVIIRNYQRFSYVPEALIYKNKIKVDKYLKTVTKLLNVKRDYAKEAYFLIETDKYLNELSKGNQKKVLLYLSLLKDNEVVFLDEPFDGLDKEVKARFINYLKESSDVTYLVCTHDMKSFSSFNNKEVIKFAEIY